MIKLINILVLLLVLLLCYCDPAPVLDLTCNGRIAAKDLSGIKSCVQGSWKMEYSKTEQGVKVALVNSYMDLKTNDSIYAVFEGNIIAEAPASWSVEPAPLISFTNWKGETFNWKIEGMDADTLFIVGENVRYALTKSSFDPTLNCNTVLRDKALNQIRSCIYGNWQLHYRFGGFSGSDKDYYTIQTQVNFRASDSVDYIGGGVSSSYKINWVKTKDSFGEMTYIMGFENSSGYPIRWGVSQIRQDTLVLYDNWPDGYSYYLSEIN